MYVPCHSVFSCFRGELLRGEGCLYRLYRPCRHRGTHLGTRFRYSAYAVPN